MFGLFGLTLARLSLADPDTGADPEGPVSGALSGIYEPSGLVHLGEAQFILIEDEADSPFHLLRLTEAGGLQRISEIFQAGDQGRLNDLEGIAYDGEFIYAITSHSLTKNGKKGKDRSVLARYRYLDAELQAAGAVVDLKPYLIKLLNARYPQRSGKKLKKQLNIEALSWSPETQKLYIGLRAPVIENMSLLIRIDNPTTLFEQSSASEMRAVIMPLNLGGVGIRAMNWDEQQQQFLLIAGDKKQGQREFALWRWEETEGEIPQKLQTVMSATEGLVSFDLPDRTGRVLLQDDGKRKKSEPAHYQWIPRKP